MHDDNMDCSLQQLDRTVPTEDKSADVIHLDLSKQLNHTPATNLSHSHAERRQQGEHVGKKKTNGVVTQEVNFYNQR